MLSDRPGPKLLCFLTAVLAAAWLSAPVVAGTVGYEDRTVANGPFWTRPDAAAGDVCAAGESPWAEHVSYRYHVFAVDQPGDYDIVSNRGFDSYLHVFEEPFDPVSPTSNCIAASRGDPDTLDQVRIQRLALASGVTYVVVTSGAEEGQFGSFINFISGPGNIVLGPSGGDPLSFDPLQRQALEALYDATDGPNWRHADNWLGAAETECSWVGVVCGDLGGMAGVIHLDLRAQNLNGPLPPVFAALPGLQNLLLNSNLSLSGNLADLGPLPALQRLSLGSNSLTGDLGAFLHHVLTQTDLRDLWLDTLPSIDQIQFPTGVGESLLFLFLSGDNFTTGPFPAALTESKTLSLLFLRLFNFTRPLPAEIGDLSSLQFFTVNASVLPGTLPPEIGMLSGLNSLQIVFNRGMSGGIPAAVGQLTGLENLIIDGNSGLGGEIPASIGNLTGLETLDLSGNQHTGVLPKTVSALTRLRYLDLSNNPDLSGAIPDALLEREKVGMMNLLIDGTRLLRLFLGALGGLWYDPALDGSGFSFVSTADGMLATYYGYGLGGQPLWLISEPFPSPLTLGEEITDIALLHGPGGGGLQAPLPPSALAEWGRMSLRFDACTRARATLEGVDGQLALDLYQLAFNQGGACTLAPPATKAVARSADRSAHRLAENYRALLRRMGSGPELAPARIAELMRNLESD